MVNLYFGDMLPPQRDDHGKPEHVLVGTASRVQLVVRPVEHHLTPEHTICIGTFHDEQIIGRCAIPEESVDDFLEMDLFDEPVALALNVRLGGPGIEGSLLALVPMEQAEDGDASADEPWRASIPGAAFDNDTDTDGDTKDEGAAGSNQLVGIFLGEIVRFDCDRKNPDSLLREAADMLAGVIRGQVGTVVDRVIEDLTT